MTSILYLLGISAVLGGFGLLAFLWSLRAGQYEDMEGAATRILFDEDATAMAPAKVATRRIARKRP